MVLLLWLLLVVVVGPILCWIRIDGISFSIDGRFTGTRLSWVAPGWVVGFEVGVRMFRRQQRFWPTTSAPEEKGDEGRGLDERQELNKEDFSLLLLQLCLQALQQSSIMEGPLGRKG